MTMRIEIRSIRGLEYKKEDNIYNIKDNELFNKIMDLIEQTSIKSEIIEMCGHAIYMKKVKYHFTIDIIYNLLYIIVNEIYPDTLGLGSISFYYH